MLRARLLDNDTAKVANVALAQREDDISPTSEEGVLVRQTGERHT